MRVRDWSASGTPGWARSSYTRSRFTPWPGSATVADMPQQPKPDKRAAPVPLPLPELIARLQELDSLTGIERARLAKGPLSTVVQASVAAAGDEGIWQAKRGGMSYKDIMAAMEYADDGPVARAISAHNKRREARS